MTNFYFKEKSEGWKTELYGVYKHFYRLAGLKNTHDKTSHNHRNPFHNFLKWQKGMHYTTPRYSFPIAFQNKMQNI